MKANYVIACALCCCSLVLASCGGGKNPNTLAASNEKLFQTADPGVKASWDSAMTAFKTNGYATAILSLQEISRGTNTAVTPEQIKAANDTVTAISDAMYTAANKGDARARESIDELRKVMGR